MGIFEIICAIGGLLIGAITGLATGLELPKKVDTIKGALGSDDSEE